MVEHIIFIQLISDTRSVRQKYQQKLALQRLPKETRPIICINRKVFFSQSDLVIHPLKSIKYFTEILPILFKTNS